MRIPIKKGKYDCIVAKEGNTQITLKSDKVTAGRVNLKEEGYLIFIPLKDVEIEQGD